MRRLTVFLFVLALVTSGCGSDDKGKSDALRDALAATKEAKTAKYSLVIGIKAGEVAAGSRSSGSTTTAAAAELVELKVNGVWNLKDDLVRSKVNYSTSAGGAGADYIVIKKVVYVSGLQAPAGKWRVFDGSEGGVGEDSLGVLRPDPVLETLAGVTGPAKKVGSETIDGVATTHYRAAANLKLASTRADLDTREALKARLENTRGTKADVDVWVDAQGRIRRLVTVTTAKDGKSTYRTTLDLSDFGTAANIEAPPTADIDGPVPTGDQ